MRKYILIALMLPAFFLTCKKNQTNFHDLSGDSIIRGTVVLYDTLTAPFNYYGVHPLTVYLRYPSDSTSYLYSAVTNGLGQFSFSGIDPKQSYVVYGRMDSLQIHFYGQINYPANTSSLYATDTLALYPSQINQNGIFYHLQDSAGGPLAGCSLYIFSSKQLWKNNDSVGAVYTLKSDAYGRCLQMNVDPGEYYVRAMGTFAGLALDSTDSVHVSVDSIQTRYLTLAVVKPSGNKLIYNVQDSLGDPLPQVGIYLFNSRVLWASSDFSGSAYFFKSDSTGKGKLSNIAPGNYYVHALSIVGSLQLQAVDSFSMPAAATVTRTIQLAQ